jgi:hypothetical protein
MYNILVFLHSCNCFRKSNFQGLGISDCPTLLISCCKCTFRWIDKKNNACFYVSNSKGVFKDSILVIKKEVSEI